MKPVFLLVLHLISLVLLGLGWTLDMLTIKISFNIPFAGPIYLMDETRSVLSTLENLWETANYFPFILIGLFGIIVPLVKTFFIFKIIGWPQKTGRIERKFVDGISKWAMADVFAVAILVSFLAASALDSTYAELKRGFYYFASYVLVSNAIVMFIPSTIKFDQPNQ
jgi:uncharacterized paraquat-inducible protein A